MLLPVMFSKQCSIGEKRLYAQHRSRAEVCNMHAGLGSQCLQQRSLLAHCCADNNTTAAYSNRHQNQRQPLSQVVTHSMAAANQLRCVHTCSCNCKQVSLQVSGPWQFWKGMHLSWLSSILSLTSARPVLSWTCRLDSSCVHCITSPCSFCTCCRVSMFIAKPANCNSRD